MPLASQHLLIIPNFPWEGSDELLFWTSVVLVGLQKLNSAIMKDMQSQDNVRLEGEHEAHVWMLSGFGSIQAWTASFAEELEMELNIVQSIINGRHHLWWKDDH